MTTKDIKAENRRRKRESRERLSQGGKLRRAEVFISRHPQAFKRLQKYIDRLNKVYESLHS